MPGILITRQINQSHLFTAFGENNKFKEIKWALGCFSLKSSKPMISQNDIK